jgi:lactate dehydrogenase-like 2-hydroxyacid dehydrogenase
MRVLLANWNNEDDAELEKKLFGSLVSFDVQRVRLGESNALSPDLAAQADAIINCSGTLTIGAALEKFERCKICVRAGVGYDNLDLKALGEPGQTHLNFHKPNMVEFKACNITLE